MKYSKINPLLQLPVFVFGKATTLNLEWEKKYGLYCNHALTGFEMDVYTALLAFNEGKEDFAIKARDIADLLKLDNRIYSGKINQALYRLAGVRYSFAGCFDKKTISLTLLENIEKQGNRRGSYFTYSLPQAIANLLANKKFQRLCFDTYLALPTGIPRRLFEFLSRRKKQKSTIKNGYFEIAEEKLSRWLPIYAQYPSHRLRTMHKAIEALEKIHFLEKVEFREKYLRFYYCIETKDQTVRTDEKLQNQVPKKIEILDKPDISKFAEIKSYLTQAIPSFSLAQFELNENKKAKLIEYFPTLYKKIEQKKRNNYNIGGGLIYKWIAEKEEYIPGKKELEQIKENLHQQQIENTCRELRAKNLQQQRQLELKEQIKHEFLCFIEQNKAEIFPKFETLVIQIEDSLEEHYRAMPGPLKERMIMAKFFSTLVSYINCKFKKDFLEKEHFLCPATMRKLWDCWELKKHINRRVISCTQ